MFKRVVSLLLLPTVLLTQWASAAQCHGCRHLPGHDRTPHVHLTGFSFTEATPQASGKKAPAARGCCCHNQGDQDTDDQDGGKKNQGNDQSGKPGPQEDSTGHQHGGGVVYLPTSLIHGWLTGRSLTGPDDVVKAPALALLDGLLIHVQPLVCAHHPPAFLGVSDSPAYLRTLPLLI